METQKEPILTLLETIFTTRDAQEYIEHIDGLLTDIYSIERKSILTVLDETLPEDISKGIKDYLSITKISLTNQEEVRIALTTLENGIRKARILSLTLAYTPSKKMTANICWWVKKEFGDDVVVELNTNPELVGGAIIVFEGKYIDQSVKKKLDILFEVKKEEILKFLL